MDEKLTYTDHNNIIISEVQLQKVQVSFAWMYINSILKVNGLLIFITIFIRVLSCCSVNLRAVFEGLNERNKTTQSKVREVPNYAKRLQNQVYFRPF